MVREPAVAGSFYPLDRDELVQMLHRIIPERQVKTPCLGVVAPHAGYIYSGAIAGELFAATRLPRRIVILGPNHQGLGSAAAVCCRGDWQTPLGPVPVAADLAGHLMSRSSMLVEDVLAHRFEHSIEVQVPLLQFLQPELSIVPICLGSATLEDWLVLGRDLGRALEDWPEEVLIVASSDMNHFLSAEATEALDQLAIDAALALDPARLYRTVRRHNISMCGVVPAVVMLQAALERGATSCRLVRYGHSGEVNGDLSRVVGYAALAVS